MPGLVPAAAAASAAYYQLPVLDVETVYDTVVPGLLPEVKPPEKLAATLISEKVENFLRSSMKFSALAYCQDWEILSKSCVGCADSAFSQLDQPYYFRAENNQGDHAGAEAFKFDVQGFIGVDHATESVVVSFRGPMRSLNWTTVFATKAPTAKAEDNRFYKDSFYRFHEGFAYAYKLLKPQVSSRLRLLMPQHPSYMLTFVGHSMGGAIAHIAAFDALKDSVFDDIGYLRSDGFDVSRANLVTFGAPRIGSDGLARVFNNMGLGNVFRVVDGADAVPHWPESRLGFRHIRGEVYFHPETGKAQFCDDWTQPDDNSAPEDTMCSAATPPASRTTSAHPYYFGWRMRWMCEVP